MLWLEQLPVFPTRMDHKEPEQARDTLVGKCRQWTRGHKRREETGKKPKAAVDAFLPAKAQEIPKGIGGGQPSNKEGGEGVENGGKPDMGRIARKALSFLTWGQGRRAEGRRFRAARDPGTGGQGTGQTAARVPCKGCNGHHPQEKAAL
mgnify:CR=1 FL=1